MAKSKKPKRKALTPYQKQKRRIEKRIAEYQKKGYRLKSESKYVKDGHLNLPRSTKKLEEIKAKEMRSMVEYYSPETGKVESYWEREKRLKKEQKMYAPEPEPEPIDISIVQRITEALLRIPDVRYVYGGTMIDTDGYKHELLDLLSDNYFDEENSTGSALNYVQYLLSIESELIMAIDVIIYSSDEYEIYANYTEAAQLLAGRKLTILEKVRIEHELNEPNEPPESPDWYD